ncbi:helix-turn-helix domain-containing protein [Streptomyces sp. WMMC897]|uniref:helix-turn-helix domain-containing protein n=1 Tax=Streptomyces sp. WMMC897 TaxID=3014782 RepID=UPI0022B6C3B1|nr:helix-turn-helix domain-containing protein [Streptomyces sp. WMMC897]MCZ7414730.1 helix-turn-helix domain-containing protein [Streptomyces sp. WMMC897]
MPARPQGDRRATLHGGLPDRYLTPEDLASLLAVPVETVYSWRRKRTGPPGFRVGKHLRYDPAAVHAWITARTEQNAA